MHSPLAAWRRRRDAADEARIIAALTASLDVFGADLAHRTRLPAGRLYPALHRLETVGAVTARVEPGTGWLGRRRWTATNQHQHEEARP